MIKANELRLGNWILPDHDLDGAYHRVKELGDQAVNNYVESWYSPIPLTPEILEKAGFEAFDNRWTKPAMYGTLAYEKDGWVLEDYETGNVTLRPISAVHQLQNLFYTLTGDELNFEL